MRMKTGARATAAPRAARATSVESVRFRDGDIVTADDLDAAMRYSASMLHAVLRSYLGCGIVCGLELTVKDQPRSSCDPVVIHIAPGLVVDCHGHPVELCGGLDLILPGDDDPCAGRPDAYHIAIKRSTSDEASTEVCGCGTGRTGQSCNREREHALIAAIPSDCELDEHSICRRPVPTVQEDPRCNGSELSTGTKAWKDVGNQRGAQPSTGGEAIGALCECLTACPDQRCCGDSWVLLGSVTFHDEGRTELDATRRRYVKPIECRCGPAHAPVPEASQRELEARLAGLEQRLDEMEAHDEHRS